jgi:VacB/RNase II family 3'-5' exoribonuclease
MESHDQHHRALLEGIARKAMIAWGLLPDFSAEAIAELGRLQAPAAAAGEPLLDLTALLWCSIDNDDSLDLDQLTVAQQLPDGKVKILIAVADVDSLVKKGSAIDDHARTNTTSVYTAAKNFPMLPEKLSTDLTSLNTDVDRVAMIVEIIVAADGSLQDSGVYQARVRNRAKLAYNSVAAWLEEGAAMPAALGAVNGLAENLKLQDQAAQRMKNFRHLQGALNLETIEAKAVFLGDEIRDLEVEKRNRAKDIIEDFMIAANGEAARYLASKKFPSIRRVVRVPKRWDRIVEVAKEHQFTLPAEPDSKALDQFLVSQRAADPERFPDLSLTVIKLLGSGEYIAEPPEGLAPGHFGLAVRDYSHSTAPNRRFPDLLTQRLLKAAVRGEKVPYENGDLQALAKHCTDAEDAANKVERQVGKSAAALLFESRIGEQFDSFVTGASDKGTWVRLVDLPVEGRLDQGFQGLDVGNRVRVQLISTDVERGYIDFKKV